MSRATSGRSSCTFSATCGRIGAGTPPCPPVFRLYSRATAGSGRATVASTANSSTPRCAICRGSSPCSTPTRRKPSGASRGLPPKPRPRSPFARRSPRVNHPWATKPNFSPHGSAPIAPKYSPAQNSPRNCAGRRSGSVCKRRNQGASSKNSTRPVGAGGNPRPCPPQLKFWPKLT